MNMSSLREISIWPNRLLCGEGSLDQLAQAIVDLKCKRAFVICGATVASGPILDLVRSALGAHFVGMFGTVKMHSPLPDLSSLVRDIQACDADVLVSVGGGSAIDAAKGASLLLASGGDLDLYAIKYGETGMQRALLPRRAIAHIAIPTTAGSASEVMSTAGIRDPEHRKKMLFWDDLLIPDAVILDPRIAAFANPVLTSTSGMTAVARCVESLYSVNRHPISTALALHALRVLNRALPACIDDPDDLLARSDCQYACAMSGIAAINAMVSLVHAVGHAVGGRYGLQHGVSHAILLAPSMRLMMPSLGEEQALVFAALGGNPSGLDAHACGVGAADAMDALLAKLPLKRRLRDLGIPTSELADIAKHTETEYMMANLPRPVSTQEVEALLQAAW
jgi:alcohol dehydrogenase class IV